MDNSRRIIVRGGTYALIIAVFFLTPFAIREYRLMRMNAAMQATWSHSPVSIKSRQKPPGIPSPLLKWKFDVGVITSFPSTIRGELLPAIENDGTIYAGGKDGLFAVNPDGTKKWFYATHTPVMVSPTVDEDGTIWITTLSWLHRITSDGTGKPIVGFGQGKQVGVGFDGTIYMAAAELRGTHRMLMIHPPDQIDSSYLQGEKFAFGLERHIYTVDTNRRPTLYLSDNSLQWAGGDHNDFFRDPEPAIARDGTVYVSSLNKVAAYDNNGGELWSVSVVLPTSPSISNNGTIYFGGGEDGHLYALNLDGTVQWKFDAGSSIESTPAISQAGIIYFGTDDGTLFALDKDGHEQWEFAAQGALFSPTIANDGTVYVQSSDGNLYAIEDSLNNGGLSGQWPKLAADLKNTARSPSPF